MAETETHRYTNRLASETSPYLLQHAHNPVDWYPWGSEALERARREDRPIFLSIGYAACHWCHVMERESFESPQTARLMNERFVNIKVDREERPDLDDVYMAAVQAMSGGGGWPMSVFLTPDLQPFFGGTYFPPDDRHGLPGFPRVLDAIHDAWLNRRDDVRRQATAVAAHIQSALEVPPSAGEVDRRQLEAAVRRLGSLFDATWGGFGGAPKFPAPMTIELLLRHWRRTGDVEALRMATLTLDRMAAGGIYDQLGGGFARYSTDARWLVPHFEKMLYDNALLAHAYLEAFRATGERRYRQVTVETLDFLLREMQTDEGGFAAALDADSEGEEGRFYVWTDEEFRGVLRDAQLSAAEVDALARFWGVSAEGSWEGRNILHRAGSEPDEALVERARAALTDERERRVRPARDDKVLAAWNGMVLRAFAAAGLVLDEERFRQAAHRLVELVRGTLLRPDDRLWRTTRDGRAHTPGFAEDYLNLADGLLAAYAALADAELLVLARRLLGRAVADFWDESSGTFFDTGPEHDEAVARPRSLIDSAIPSANAVGADVMLRLGLLTGDETLARRAQRIIGAVAAAFERQPTAFGRMLAAADRALGAPIDAVIAGAASDPEANRLRQASAEPYVPDLVVAPLPPDAPIAEWPLFVGKAERDGRPTAYVCRGYACDEPTSDPDRVRDQVEGLASAPS